MKNEEKNEEIRNSEEKTKMLLMKVLLSLTILILNPGSGQGLLSTMVHWWNVPCKRNTSEMGF